MEITLITTTYIAYHVRNHLKNVHHAAKKKQEAKYYAMNVVRAIMLQTQEWDVLSAKITSFTIKKNV